MHLLISYKLQAFLVSLGEIMIQLVNYLIMNQKMKKTFKKQGNITKRKGITHCGYSFFAIRLFFKNMYSDAPKIATYPTTLHKSGICTNKKIGRASCRER